MPTIYIVFPELHVNLNVNEDALVASQTACQLDSRHVGGMEITVPIQSIHTHLEIVLLS